jgi:hypothetical protein
MEKKLAVIDQLGHQVGTFLILNADSRGHPCPRIAAALLAHRKFVGNVKNAHPIFSLTYWDNYHYCYRMKRRWNAPPLLVQLRRPLLGSANQNQEARRGKWVLPERKKGALLSR